MGAISSENVRATARHAVCSSPRVMVPNVARGADPRSASALRWSLLAWLALVPLACSGSVTIEPGAADVGGTPGYGGSAFYGSPVATLPAPSGGAFSGPGGAGPAGGSVGGAIGVAGSGGARSSHGIPVCEAPTFEPASQLVVCANGFQHRAQPSVCGSQTVIGSAGASANGGEANAGGGGPNGDGESNAGAATTTMGGGSYGSDCKDDSDCPSGYACLCDLMYRPHPNGDGGCALATCRTDADCGVGSYCATGSLVYFGEADLGLGCLRADDECTTDADCHSPDKALCLEQGNRTCSAQPE
jgi:hypothetical protein